MWMTLKVVGAGVWLVLVPAAAQVVAHHAFAAEFDASKPVNLKGKVTKMEWVNPHGWIYIDVKNPDGKVVTWQIESAGAATLARAGIRREDFIGTEVVVRGFLAKDGSASANANTFTIVGSNKGFVSDEPTAPN